MRESGRLKSDWRASIAFKIKILGALSVGDGQKRPIPSLLPSQNHYLKRDTVQSDSFKRTEVHSALFSTLNVPVHFICWRCHNLIRMFSNQLNGIRRTSGHTQAATDTFFPNHGKRVFLLFNGPDLTAFTGADAA